MLKPGQKKVFEDIIQAIESGEKRVILKGSAGTGKTFLAKSIIEYFANTRIGKWSESKVYVTAPTNKALSILKTKVGGIKGVKFATTHSALKLRKFRNPKTGVASFFPVKGGKEPAFANCILAIVDECSMLNTEIIKFLDRYGFPIIFLGDDKQLNPVGELNSPIFERTYPVFELTEIVRQGAGNPIIDLSRDLDLIWFRKEKLVEGKGYTYLEDRQTIIDNLAEVNGTDDLKYLAWTNQEVDSMNKLVREKIYTTPRRIELGESLIFNEPFGDYFTNQEITVKSLDIIKIPFNYPTEITRFSHNGEWFDASREEFKVYMINGCIPILHEDSDIVFAMKKKEIGNSCKNEDWDWRGYYFFIEQFANITYNHAITVHKSQGSTYKEAIVNVGNLNFNKVIEEKQRLFYTAVTRASDLLILVNVK